MSDTVIRVEGISKKYCRSLKHTMLYGTADLSRRFLGFNQHTEKLRNDEFWAVENLSLEIKRGDCLGIIGPNGSGKSTLLKMLNGIFMPDKGRIEIKGRVGALIEVGAGFHPMLTGRENVYVNGSILGLSKKEIDKKFDAIVDFAEIGEFIDAPVKHYSSGMHVRLGFAIAVQMEPDILLIDEVLAVGDVGFRAKCFNAISKISQNAAIVLVSHQMPQIARACTYVCAMNKGRNVYHGSDVPKGIEHYYSNFEAEKSVVTGNGNANIQHIDFESSGLKDIETIDFADDLTINIHLTVNQQIKAPIIFFSFMSQELQIIAQCSSLYNSIQIQNSGTQMHIAIKLPTITFNPGTYLLSVSVLSEEQKELLVYHYAAKKLQVKGDFISFAPVQLIGQWDINHE